MKVNGVRKHVLHRENQPGIDALRPKEKKVDWFEQTKFDGVDRVSNAGVNVGKKMMHEFLATPQLVSMDTTDNWTHIPSGAIGFRVEQKLHHANDPFVTDSELRSFITQELIKEGAHQVVWSERSGIMEPGLGIGGTLPILTPCGLGFAFNLGFQANALLSYRIIKPAKLQAGESETRALKERSFDVPLEAGSALRMARGTQFEFIGSGRLAASQGPVIFEGLDVVGISTFGVGATVVANESISGEYRIKVMALDGRGKMRVTIEKINQASVGASAKLMAGLISPTNSVLPAWGDGVLAFILQNRIQNPLQNLLANIWSVNASVNLKVERNTDKLFCFDLDLRDEQTHYAYRNLFWLDPREANKLCARGLSSASRLEWKEKGWRIARSLEATALSDQIYLREVYRTKRKGELINSTDEKTLYVDGIYGKKFKSVIRGNKSIRWESVKIDKSDGGSKLYYGFFYNKFDRIPRQPSIDRFFGFAKSLGVYSEVEKCSKLIHLPFIEKVLSSADDTKTKVELFFSEVGVERILNANMEEGLKAFLQAQALGDSYYFGHPFLTDDWPHAERLFVNFVRQMFSGEAEKLKVTTASYSELFDRDLARDLFVYSGAKKFGKRVGKWTRAKDKRDAADFFTWMGQSKSLRYTDLIPALTVLAGRQNVIVHALSMSGGGVSIKSVDEGEIIHPRDQLNNLVNSSSFRHGK